MFVNEFTKKHFHQALVRQVIAGKTLINGGLEKAKGRESGLKELIGELQKSNGVRLVSEETRGAIIVDIRVRNPKLVQTKVTEPSIIVNSMQSLDDAIDFVNANSEALLAACHSGTAEACKYLSQFIPAQVSFVNHIPCFPSQPPRQSSSEIPNSPLHPLVPAYIIPSSTFAALSSASTVAEISKPLSETVPGNPLRPAYHPKEAGSNICAKHRVLAHGWHQTRDDTLCSSKSMRDEYDRAPSVKLNES